MFNSTSSKSTIRLALAACIMALFAAMFALPVALAAAAPAPLAGTPTPLAPLGKTRPAAPASTDANVLCVSSGGGATDTSICSNDPAYSTIGAAIAAASAGDEIRIASNTYPTMGTANVNITKSVTLIGGYPGGPSGWNTIADATSTRINGQIIVAGGGLNVSINNLLVAGGGISAASTVRVGSGYTVALVEGGALSGSFNLAASAMLLYLNGNHTIAAGSTITGAGQLQVQNSNVQINGAVSINNLQLTSGTVNGDAPSALTIPSGGTFNWVSGVHGGSGSTTIASGATMNIGGVSAGHTLIQRTLNNNGTVNLNGSGIGTFALSDGAIINNGASVGSSAQFVIANDDLVVYSGGEGPTFNNRGTVRKSAGSGVSVFGNGFLILNNSGAIRAESGTLSLDSFSTDLAASTYFAAVGARLRFNANTHNIAGSSTVTVPGTIEFASGTVNVAGTFNVTGSVLLTGGATIFNAPATIGTLNISEPSVVYTVNGIINIGTLNWSAGSITAASIGAGTINISGALNLGGVQTGKFLSNVTINNNGIATMNTTGIGALYMGSGAVFNNKSGAQFNITNNDSVYYLNGALPTFNNNLGAILRKTGGSGVSTLSNGFMQFNNAGTVNVVTGTLSLDGGASPGSVNTHSGSFNISNGALLRFGYANGASVNNLLSTAHVLGSGNVEVNEGIMTTAGEYNVTGVTSITGGGGNASFDAAVSTLGSATILAGTMSGAGLVRVNVNFNWNGGTMTSQPGVRAITELGPNATLNLGGVTSSKYLLRRVLNNYGTTYMNTTGIGALFLGDNAEFNNYNKYYITNNDSVLYANGPQSNFNNYRIFTKTGGAGISTVGSGNLAFNNQKQGNIAAAVEVVTGTLSLDGGGIDTGSFQVDVNQGAARLRFNGGTHTLQTGSSVTGPGDVEFSLGAANFAGVYNVTGNTNITGGTANFNNEVNAQARVLNLRAGTLAGDGAIAVTELLDWTGGTMDGAGGSVSTTNVGAAATFYIRGLASAKVLTARTINNNGSAFMNGTGAGVFLIGNGGTFNNLKSLDIQNDDSILYQGGTLSHIRNSGTLIKSAGANITTLGNGQLDFNNTGAVTVVTGTISLDGGGIDTGSFDVRVSLGAARLRFNGGTHTLQSGSSVSGPGDVEFSAGVANFSGSYAITGKTLISGGTVGFNSGVNATATLVNFSSGVLTGNGTFNVGSGGILNWTGGTMDGAGAITSTTNIAAGATMNIGGVSSAKALSARTLNNYGNTLMNGTGIGVLTMGNGAHFNNAQTGSFAIQNDDSILFSGGTAAVFNNIGIFQKAAGNATSTVGNGALSFINNGVLRSNTGVINFAENFSQGADGTTYLNGGDLLTTSHLDFVGGSIVGTGAITGTVNNIGGTLAPSGTTATGSVSGLITVNGDYTQGGTGAINIGIGGTTPVVSYDRVSILRNATLTGTLNLTLVGYTPNPGETYVPLTYSNRNDTAFKTINGLNFAGRSFQVTYNPTDLTLAVISGQATSTPTTAPGTATPTVTGTPATATPTAPPGSCTVSFSDVSNSNPFYDFVQYLACQGVISGYSDGTFRPGNNTTRGQLAKIVVVAMGWALVTPQTGTFNDVSTSNPFYTVIETAYNHGVISGYADGTFRPGANVTRGQLSKIVVAAKDWALVCPVNATFTDVSTNNPFFCQVETALAHGIISGYECGANCREFRPGNNATRGQISKIITLAVRE